MPSLVVANPREGVAAGLQQRGVLGDGPARRLAARLLEHLDLDPLGASESALVLSEIVVEPAGTTQVLDEPAGVCNPGKRIQGDSPAPSSLARVEPSSPPSQSSL